jgi:hypothetical protein
MDNDMDKGKPTTKANGKTGFSMVRGALITKTEC